MAEGGGQVLFGAGEETEPWHPINRIGEGGGERDARLRVGGGGWTGGSRTELALLFHPESFLAKRKAGCVSCMIFLPPPKKINLWGSPGDSRLGEAAVPSGWAGLLVGKRAAFARPIFPPVVP